MKTGIVEKLKDLFDYADWIEECIYDEEQKAFVMLTTDNIGFALEYTEEDFTMQEVEKFLNNHSKEDFKNLLGDLFHQNPVMGYMLFTILELNKLNIIDMETSLNICRQMTEHEEEILRISAKFNDWYS